MTSNSTNGSRLDRIETLMLELATASVRHDNEFSRINSTLDRLSQQQEALTAKQELNQEAIANLTAKQDLNQEAIAHLTASIQDLRNLVADYIQGRS